MGNSCCKKSLSDRQKDSSLIYSVNSENDKVCTMQSLRFPETDAGNSGTNSTDLLCLLGLCSPFAIQDKIRGSYVFFQVSAIVFHFKERFIYHVTLRDPLAADGMRSVPSLCPDGFICDIRYTLL